MYFLPGRLLTIKKMSCHQRGRTNIGVALWEEKYFSADQQRFTGGSKPTRETETSPQDLRVQTKDRKSRGSVFIKKTTSIIYKKKTEAIIGCFLRKLWCYIGGGVKQENLVLSTEFIGKLATV